MVIAKIASVELPRMDWPELIPSLLENMKHQPPISSLKQCTLESMGYICEEMGQMQDNLLSQDQVRVYSYVMVFTCSIEMMFAGLAQKCTKHFSFSTQHSRSIERTTLLLMHFCDLCVVSESFFFVLDKYCFLKHKYNSDRIAASMQSRLGW